ncbi:MAG: hypothetical protein F9K29_00160 [Hyphomicrobiaceae bacterium]|nr:MAG: hypothetical protein F9K29_00160 [Hyphomicrobiaceae bacterium]
MRITDLETPRLLLDLDRLERNTAAMRAHCRSKSVALRPHVKTAKSLDVTLLATGGEPLGITVSTLKEADYFARAGYGDILYAVGIVPRKLAHAARIVRETGVDLVLVTDALSVALAAGEFAAREGLRLSFVVEIDSGEHRSGLLPDAPAMIELARAIHQHPRLALRGVMTHAGHSYATDDPAGIRKVARLECEAARAAAEKLRGAGMPCDIVSVGSTPTVLLAESFDGITEVRCGIYMFWDLSQLSRKVCKESDLAASVLASVIGHNRTAGALILDAGALALSKDLGANAFMPGTGYGLLCDPFTMERLGDLAVTIVHQEHGTVPVKDEAWYERLPVGSLVRVLPNHACITCAAYDSYDVVRGGEVIGSWSRINGW